MFVSLEEKPAPAPLPAHGGLGEGEGFFPAMAERSWPRATGTHEHPTSHGDAPSSSSPSPRGKRSPGTSGNSDASLQPNRGKINKPRYAQPEKQTAWRRGEQRRAYGFFLCASHLIWTKSPRKRHCMNTPCSTPFASRGHTRRGALGRGMEPSPINCCSPRLLLPPHPRETGSENIICRACGFGSG